MASRNSLCDGAKADSGDGPYLLNSTFAPKQGDLSVAETRGVGDDVFGAEQIVSLEWEWKLTGENDRCCRSSLVGLSRLNVSNIESLSCFRW